MGENKKLSSYFQFLPFPQVSKDAPATHFTLLATVEVSFRDMWVCTCVFIETRSISVNFSVSFPFVSFSASLLFSLSVSVLCRKIGDKKRTHIHSLIYPPLAQPDCRQKHCWPCIRGHRRCDGLQRALWDRLAGELCIVFVEVIWNYIHKGRKEEVGSGKECRFYFEA